MSAHAHVDKFGIRITQAIDLIINKVMVLKLWKSNGNDEINQ